MGKTGQGLSWWGRQGWGEDSGGGAPRSQPPAILISRLISVANTILAKSRKAIKIKRLVQSSKRDRLELCEVIIDKFNEEERFASV